MKSEYESIAIVPCGGNSLYDYKIELTALFGGCSKTWVSNLIKECDGVFVVMHAYHTMPYMVDETLENIAERIETEARCKVSITK